MSHVRQETITLPAAPLGPDNPLPPLLPPKGPHAGLDASGADPEMSRNLEIGHLRTLLPYTVQDEYGRDRRPTTVDSIVLENDRLQATFLPTWGGRLWSLIDRTTGRELLYRNPILQPANFALRGAWLAGGIEWNIGATGHSPLTCSPLHAARVVLDDGTPVLRLYEWERIRGVAFQVDAWLPDGSPVLLVRVRIVNPWATEVPMYWWTNIAVDETDDVRVLAPADTAYHFSYDNRLRLVDIPEHDGTDVTYPAHARRSADYFFECERADRPWIAAIDGRGEGFAQVSTSTLRGRKLFCWGRAAGGRHWQELLSGPDAHHGYCEIQAGLARTQLERLPMPAGARWSWVEAYGPVQVDPDTAHGGWSVARATVAYALDELLAGRNLDDVHNLACTWSDLPPVEPLSAGSGWGALEGHRRRCMGEAPLDLPGLPFPDESIGPAEQSWRQLLDAGGLPPVEPDDPPPSYAAGPTWLRLLDRSADDWTTWLHRGVARWAGGDVEGALDAWHRSTAARANGWALRNLACADSVAGRKDAAADRLLDAHRLLPTVRALTIETLTALLDAGRPSVALDLIDELAVDDGSVGRIQLLDARAALAAGDLTRAGALVERGIVVPDLREGGAALESLWFDYCAALRAAGRPRTDEDLPYAYDFRMHTGSGGDHEASRSL